jgi:hypothetical protein
MSRSAARVEGPRSRAGLADRRVLGDRAVLLSMTQGDAQDDQRVVDPLQGHRGTAARRRDSAVHAASPSAGEVEPPRAIRPQGPQPCSRSRDASDMALRRKMLRRSRTVRTDLERRLLPCVLPRAVSKAVVRAAPHRGFESFPLRLRPREFHPAGRIAAVDGPVRPTVPGRCRPKHVIGEDSREDFSRGESRLSSIADQLGEDVAVREHELGIG